MKTEDILKICNDFRIYNDPETGKDRCMYYRDKTCSLPDKFLCKFLDEMARRKEESTKITKPVPETAAADGPVSDFEVSFSRVSLFNSCPYKYYLRYVEHAEPEVEQKWKIVGSAYHKAIETAYRTKGEGVSFETTGDEFEDFKIKAIIEGIYDKIFTFSEADMYEVEEPFKLRIPIVLPERKPWSHILIRGYVDLYDRRNLAIVEHKTSGDIEGFSLLNVLYQFSVYKAVKDQAKMYSINLIQKPRQRPKKGEGPVEFYQRILGEVREDPTKYYKRVDFHETEVDFKYYFDEFLLNVDTILFCHERGVFVRNPLNCLTMECEYRKTCVSRIKTRQK